MKGGARRRGGACLLAAWVAGFAGCATPRAPRGWLSSAQEMTWETYGGWVQVERKKGSDPRRVDGELIAATADALFVLEDLQQPAVATRIELGQIEKVQVYPHSTLVAGIGAWGLLGTISTVSHGWWLLLSAPAWIAFSTLSAAGESRVDRLEYPQAGSLESLRTYARFPAALPARLETRTFEPKRADEDRESPPDGASP